MADISSLHPETERWLPVVGWEGYYEVSDLGRVRSVDRVIRYRDGRTTRQKGLLLRIYTNPDGYRSIQLSRSGSLTRRSIYQLVAESFHGPRPTSTSEVQHLNGNSSDDRASNLRWGTKSDNTYDSVAHGTHNRARRERCKNGHRLIEPNLRRDSTPRLRRCLACHRGDAAYRQAVRRGQLGDRQSFVDRYYAQIMAGQPAA